MGETTDKIGIGNVEVLPHERSVRVGGQEVALTRREFDILEMLASHPGWVFSPEQLAGDQLLDYTSPFAVNVHVAHLRQKLAEAGAPKLIVTVRGSGYKLVPPRDARTPPKLASAGGPVGKLIGRETELSAFEQARADVEAGSGRIVLVAGEPGIGKTALADAAIAAWPDQSFEYVRAVCDGNGSGEHWMWRQVLPEIARRTAIAFESVDEGGLLRAMIGDAGHAPTDSLSGADRALAYDAVARYLTLAAGSSPRPIVLFVDDLHWADASSLKLLTYVARRFVGIDLLLVLTTRDPLGHAGRPLSETLANVRRSDACIHLHLEGLSAAEIDEAVALVLGRPDEQLTERLAEQTGGNPLFVMEALAAIKGRGAVSDDGRDVIEPSRIPDSIALLVREQVAGLAEGTQTFLRAAAVAGVSFSPDLAARAAGLDPSSDCAQGALDARLLVDGDLGHLRFRHALFRAALLGDLSRGEREALHGTIAELMCCRPQDTGRWVYEVSHHYSHAGSEFAARAVCFLAAAARESRGRFGFEESSELLRRGLQLLETAELPAKRRKRMRSVLLDRLGTDLLVLSAPQEAEQAFDDAVRARPTGDALARARSYIHLGRARMLQRDRAAYLAAHDAADRALECSTTRGSGWWRTWIELQLEHRESCLTLELEPPETVAEEFLEVVERYGTIEQLAKALDLSAHERAARLRWVIDEQCLSMARRAFEVARKGDSLSLRAWVENGYGALLVCAGRYEEADSLLRDSLTTAERCEDDFVVAGTTLVLLFSARRQQDLVRTKELCHDLLGLLHPQSVPEFEAHANANLGWIALRQGRLDEARALIGAAMEILRRFPDCSQGRWQAALPALAIALDDDDLAQAVTCARFVLGPNQEALMGGVEPLLTEAIERFDSGELQGARTNLEAAVDEARRYGYV